MNDPIRVLIAEDQPIVRAGFRALLDAEADLQVVGEAADGSEAVALASSTASAPPGRSLLSRRWTRHASSS